MNIAYSCNDYYIPQTGISIISCCENNKDVEDIVFYLVSKDVSQANITILQKICNSYNRELKVINFDEIAYDLDISSIGRHIATIYTKVFFPRIKNVDKMIYFDSDIVITGSLSPLWEMNLDGYYMGVVETFAKKDIRNRLGLPVDAPFFNDGMAICNVAYCRDHDLIGKINKTVAEYNGAPPVLSEGALNKVCFGKVKYISPRWNMLAGLLERGLADLDYLEEITVYSREDLKESVAHPIVIHYLTGNYNRPWFIRCNHPYKAEYYKYKSLSPWKDIPLRDGDLTMKTKMHEWLIHIIGFRKFDKLRRYLGRE